MFRKLALTAAAVSLCATPPAYAGIFSRKAEPKTGAAAPTTAPAKPAAAAPVAPRKATAKEREVAERLDPLSRAAFWAREFEVDRTDVVAGVRLAAALRTLGQREEAAETAKFVLTLQPNNLDALLEAARAYVAAGKGFYAIEHLKTAQGLAPRDWRIPSLLGVAYDQVNRGAEAEAAWALALTLSPNNPAVLANQAMRLAANGDAARAEQLLRVAVQQPGATIKERQNLALVLGLQGKIAEAEQLTRENLPPEQAESNIAYLRAAAGGAARSWEQLRQGN